MTRTGAQTVANLAVVTVGLAAAYVILTTPPLRRTAFKVLRWWLGASVPVYVATEVRRAWVESSRPA